MILIAPDKFKSSLSAREVCGALSKGILKSNPQAQIITMPMADGGDGSLAVLAHYRKGEFVKCVVQNPLGEPVQASYFQSDRTAYIEVAAASGLALLSPEQRNCLHTSSYGTGQLIADALGRGAREIVLFLGGSATNDGGTGIATALGYTFLDTQGRVLKPTGQHLAAIQTIEWYGLTFDPAKVKFQVICDVDNPFYGPRGAAYGYAAQKGATPSEIRQLDDGLKNLATRLANHGYPDIASLPGAGAAGGIGGGAVALLGADIRSGIRFFMDLTGVEAILRDCKLVVTGEGKLDRQTERGKVVSGICDLAKKYGKPVTAVCGDAERPLPESLYLNRVFTIRERCDSTGEAIRRAAEILERIGSEL